MDSPLMSHIFRRLFAHDTCSTLRYTRPQLTASLRPRQQQRRTLFGFGKDENGRYGRREQPPAAWQQRTNVFPEDKMAEFKQYPQLTSDTLRQRRNRPREVKMLMRDFIEDSLYNPSYGYFSKQATIFTPSEPFPFRQLKDEPHFQKLYQDRYTAFEDKLDETSPNDARQLWPTPTTLFRPHYGDAMARYMVTNYKLSLFPYYDLLIYEMGAGNGTLMLNMLDYIRDNEPEVYSRTKYRIIEISSALADLQVAQLKQNAFTQGHLDKVEIVNKSIFDWDIYVASPCFFLALEVFDNFAHDCLRYDVRSGKPYQSHVLVDSKGEMFEFFEPKLDPIATRYLQIRDLACGQEISYRHPLKQNLGLAQLTSTAGQVLRKAGLESRDQDLSLSSPEYLPTRLMQFFQVLHNYFPAHKLLSSDFTVLSDAVPGINAPVVQTRYKRRTVPVTTPLVHQGYFDILFPTDFPVVERVYQAITGKFTKVLTHEDFLRRWAYVEDTETMSGENPFLGWYRNASVLVTV